MATETPENPDRERTIRIDLSGLDAAIEFARRLETIKRAFERGEIGTAEEYHRRVQHSRTAWEMSK